MTTALTERPAQAPTVTADQLDLIKKTVAHGATADELKLYLYDCARQGVHPLDKLIHFTKRSGKYTPITSIDFMRIRAADTGEYAGSDDAVFALGQVRESTFPESATVTVWRFVQGHRVSFTATARWAEYKPESNDFMWRKMPHTMLGKCAEALALRKGFPRQLAGLYAKEEMEQADNLPANAVVVNATDPDPSPVVEDGQLRIMQVVKKPTTKKNIFRFEITLSDGRVVATIKEQLGTLCQQLAQERTPVTVETKSTKWGEDLEQVHTVMAALSEAEVEANRKLDAEIAASSEAL